MTVKLGHGRASITRARPVGGETVLDRARAIHNRIMRDARSIYPHMVVFRFDGLLYAVLSSSAAGMAVMEGHVNADLRGVFSNRATLDDVLGAIKE